MGAIMTKENFTELLEYNAKTGVFRWKRNGKEAGFESHGYTRIKVKGKRYFAHRLAWLFTYGDWPENEIDHINRIKNDNRISNLRAVTHQENHHNKGAKRNNTSGAVGVVKRGKKYEAKIQRWKKYKHIGYFDTFEEAVAARAKYD